MPLDYDLLKALHILMAVVWLGTDVGTMASFFGLCNRKLAMATRLQMNKLSDLMDMGPRSALVLLLMLGIYLTYRGSWGLSGGYGAIVAGVSAVIGVGWFAGVWHQYWVHHTPEAAVGHKKFQEYFRVFDLYWRAIVTGVLVVLSLYSLVQPGPINSPWLGVKLIAFAGIVACGIYLRVLIPKIGAAVGGIIKGGSTDATEAALMKEAWPAIWSVWAIWVLISAITYLAVAKPF